MPVRLSVQAAAVPCKRRLPARRVQQCEVAWRPDGRRGVGGRSRVGRRGGRPRSRRSAATSGS